MPLTKKRILAKLPKFIHKIRFTNKQKRSHLSGKREHLLQNAILEPIDNAKLSEKLTLCNAVNSGTKDGIGNDSENINPAQTLWTLYRVKSISDKPFKLLNTDIEYHIIHAKLYNNKLHHNKLHHSKQKGSGRPLVVIPGYPLLA